MFNQRLVLNGFKVTDKLPNHGSRVLVRTLDRPDNLELADFTITSGESRFDSVEFDTPYAMVGVQVWFLVE